MITRIHGLNTFLTKALNYVGEQVVWTLVADEHAKERMTTRPYVGKQVTGALNAARYSEEQMPTLSEAVLALFDQQSTEPLRDFLVRGLQKGNPTVLALLDAYVSAANAAQDALEHLIIYPYHGGLVPWGAIRAAMREVEYVRDPLEQEAILERAVALHLWCLADAIVDRAVDQHGWYYMSDDFPDLPEHMRRYTPGWLQGSHSDRSEVLYTELRAFPLSERVLHFLDDLAVAGQREFPDELCAVWGEARSALLTIPSLQEETCVYAEAFLLEDADMAREFNAWCIRYGIPPYFAERLDRTLMQQVHEARYLVDMLDLPMLRSVAGPFLEDWLLDNAPLQEAVRVRIRPETALSNVAQRYEQAHFAVCAFPDKLLVQPSRAVHVQIVRDVLS